MDAGIGKEIRVGEVEAMTSKVVRDILKYIEDGKKQGKNTPLRTLNAVGCYPLAYRTFGGQPQGNGRLDNGLLETAFGSHYLLTMLAGGAVIHMLYEEPESCHTLYCDGWTYHYLDRHGLAEHGVWDRVDYQVLDANITMENVDHRIYYSAAKPYALEEEAGLAKESDIPVLFVDADLILKKRHDAILKNPHGIKAAYGHLEALRPPCYTDFTKLHFPDGYRLPEEFRIDLPAVNTCLMFFNDKGLLEEWCGFFKSLFLNNRLPWEPDGETISQQLLGIDQRTFPMIAQAHGLWGTDQLEAFLDITWDPPCFYDNHTGKKAEWHYYTLEHHPEHPDWLQDITHTWINKRNIERDIPYRNYQGCMMLELILELRPDMEPYLSTFESLKPYFELLKDYGTIENMLEFNVVRNRLDKSC